MENLIKETNSLPHFINLHAEKSTNICFSILPKYQINMIDIVRNSIILDDLAEYLTKDNNVIDMFIRAGFEVKSEENIVSEFCSFRKILGTYTDLFLGFISFYVTSGSYIEVKQFDGERCRYIFENFKYRRCYPDLINFKM